MQEISTQEEWNALLQSDTPFFIFKHSTTCPISSSARTRVESFIAQRDTDYPSFTLVKVIESRPLSNAIAQQLDLTHQSPQLILVNKSQSQWDASHHWITESSISEAIEALT